MSDSVLELGTMILFELWGRLAKMPRWHRLWLAWPRLCTSIRISGPWVPSELHTTCSFGCEVAGSRSLQTTSKMPRAFWSGSL
eukprot:g12660.t1